jgi:hypothetical protein
MIVQLGPRLPILWSTLMKYAVISAINLSILLIGMALGVMLAPHLEKTASANAVPQATAQPVAQATPGQNGPKVTPITPAATVGTMGVFLLLSHHVQTDELVVNGFDILKLQQAEFSMLARFVPLDHLQKAVDDAKVPEIYQINNGPAPTPPQQQPPTAK